MAHRRRFHRILAVAAFGLLLALPSSPALAGPVDLGLASKYAVYGSKSIDMTVSSGNTNVFGDLGLGPDADMAFSGGGMIHGDLDHDTGSSVNISGGSAVSGSINGTVDMQAVDDDARAARTAAESLLATQSFGSLGNGASVTGNGGLNVIDVADLSLSGGGDFTINGVAGDEFIFRISGTMVLSGGSMIVLSGVDESQVLWDFIGTGADVAFNGDSTARGTFLAIDRNIIVAGGEVFGQLISNGDELKLQSGPDVHYVAFPEPGAMSLVLLGMAGLFLRRMRRRG